MHLQITKRATVRCFSLVQMKSESALIMAMAIPDNILRICEERYLNWWIKDISNGGSTCGFVSILLKSLMTLSLRRSMCLRGAPDWCLVLSWPTQLIKTRSSKYYQNRLVRSGYRVSFERAGFRISWTNGPALSKVSVGSDWVGIT